MYVKRSLERKKTEVFFGVYERDSSKYVGRLVDINTNGLMIMGKLVFEVNTALKLKMDLPQEINGKSHIEFDVKVVWCEKSKKTKLYSAGMQFTGIAPEDSQLIDQLIGSPVFNDATGALPISAKIETLK